MTVQDVADGKGNWVLLDLPVPLEPVIVDIDRPMEEQMLSQTYIDAANKMVNELRAKL